MPLDIRAFVNNYREFSVSPPALIQASSSCNSITLTILLQIPYWHFSAMLRAKYVFLSKIDGLHVLSLFLVLSPSYSCFSPTPPQLFPERSILSLYLSFQKKSEVRWQGEHHLQNFLNLQKSFIPIFVFTLISSYLWELCFKTPRGFLYLDESLPIDPGLQTITLFSLFITQLRFPMCSLSGMFSLHGGPCRLTYC